MDDAFAKSLTDEIAAFEAQCQAAISSQNQTLKDALAKQDTLNKEFLALAQPPAPG